MREFFRRDTLLWVAAGVAVGLNGLVGSYNVQRMRTTEEAVRDARGNEVEVGELLSDIKDAETGHRGYMLTGRDEYLEPFRQAEARIPKRLDLLRDHWDDQPAELERLPHFEQLIGDKFTEMRRTLAIRDAIGPNADRLPAAGAVGGGTVAARSAEALQVGASEVASGEGKQLMDDLRREGYDAMTAEELNLAARGEEAVNQYRTAEMTNLFGAGLAVGVLVVTAVLARRELRRRIRLSDALAVEKQATDRAFGQLDALVRNAPYSIAFLDEELRAIRVNETFARTNRMALEDHFGRRLPELFPDIPSDLLTAYKEVLAGGPPLVGRIVYGGDRVWEVSAFQVPIDDDRMGLGVIGQDVTERHSAAERVREAQRFSESVLHSLPSHLAVIDDDGQILTVNESWRQFAIANGIPPDHDWTKDNYFNASVRDQPHGERAVTGIRAVARGERGAFEMEYPCHAPTQERYFLLRANRFRGDGPVRLVITHENISDRVRAEREVRERASQLVQLTEGMPFLMWACRPSGECDYLSRQWVEYTGVRGEDHLGGGWMEAVHPDDRESTTAAWRAAVEGAGDETVGYDVEFRLRRHDGAYRWFAVRGIPLRDAGGRIVRWYGSCADIDDRKRQAATLERLVTERTAALHQANAELVQQRSFVDAILDNVAEGIVACDADGRLKLFNAATRHMHGLDADPLPPERWAERYSLFEADGVTPLAEEEVPLTRAWRGEVVKDAEMVIRPADPSVPERFVLCSGQPLRTPAGEPFGAVVSMRDTTERREYERQLLRTTAALEASNEDLEKFAYIASHDLQEPLRKIQAFGDRLTTKFRENLGDQGKDYVDRMLDSAGRMRRLIEDLLAFSRVNTRSRPPVPVDLNVVVRDVLSDLEEQLHRTGGRAVVGPLPTIAADPAQLGQVLQNLVGNALKFNRTGVAPEVTVSATPLAEVSPDTSPPPPGWDGWRIRVADNGIGFEPEHADRIFELFQRLHGRTKYEGTGLGLAIVKKIVARHGGTITAHGRPGEGAEFIIDWPSQTGGDGP